MFSKLLDLEQKISMHPRISGIINFFARPRGFVLVLALIALAYSCRVDLHPGLHGDEMSLLAVPYRTAEYGDYSYPLIFTESHNAGPVRHYPPIMAMMLRTFWHQAVGFSDHASRFFSGLMMATLAGLFGLLMFKRSQGDWKRAVTALICIGLNPALIVAARTVRFEQEIVFMGGLAFLLPLLLLRGVGPWLARLVWVVSGLCASWAAFSHPWGMVFPFVLVVTFLFKSAAWREEDELGFFDRIFFFGLGCLPPFAATALQVLHGWPGFLTYLQDAGLFYEMRHDQMVNYFLKRYSMPFFDPGGVPGRIVASILQLHMTGDPATATKLGGIDVLPIGFLFQILFWSFLAALFTWKRHLQKPFYVRLWIFLAAAFVVFGLLYPPNQVYVLYANFAVLAAVLSLRGVDDCRYLAAGVRVYAGLCILFTAAYMVFLTVAPGVRHFIPLDARFAALREMNAAVGLKDGVVYTDSATWYAGGKDVKAYPDILRTGKIEPSAAFVIDADIFNSLAKSMGAHFLPEQEPGKTWQEHLDREFSQKVLRALIIVESGNTGYYYLMPTNVENPILITLYDKKGDQRKFRGSYKDMVPMRRQLARGWYMLMSPPGAPVTFSALRREKAVKLHYARMGDRIASLALIEASGDAVLNEADPKIVMVPLLEGWKAGK